jgi:hypothetical protein
VAATIYYFNAPPDARFVEFFENRLRPLLIDSGAPILAYFVTENSENTFPDLPVRKGENVFVWFARFSDPAAYQLHVGALARSPRWQDEIAKELMDHLSRAPEILKLSPTSRSLL